MRLTREQTLSILETVSCRAGKNAKVFLFGSRLNDQARGGDVDLLIETDHPLTLIERARIKMHLEQKLGLPVDIIAQNRSGASTPFYRIAQSQAMPLEATA